jgi:hypothetical protein
MELVLTRAYFSDGTNGELYHEGERICFTIELPWKDNHTAVSCIPEGRYALAERYSPKLKGHLQLMNVPGRELILIHPANDAIKELKGCIAPVSFLTAAGRGGRSRPAFEKLTQLVFTAFAKSRPIYLTIKSNLYEDS